MASTLQPKLAVLYSYVAATGTINSTLPHWLTLLEPQSHMWGQTIQISSSFVPKRDCGSKGVNPICATQFHRRFHPFSSAVPFWGQTSQILSSLSPKRDCTTKRVNAKNTPDTSRSGQAALLNRHYRGATSVQAGEAITRHTAVEISGQYTGFPNMAPSPLPLPSADEGSPHFVNFPSQSEANFGSKLVAGEENLPIVYRG